ncbi:MAG: hypothetical protein ACO25K_05370 [Candidatus Fonsibacter ubiquis]
MNLVRGEFFPSISNKIILHYDKLFCDPNSIENGDIVYCDTHYILEYKDILNTKKDLTIITHNSDHCLYDGITDKKNSINVDELQCYSRWFGQNSYSKKVIPIPIGFENMRWESVFGPKTDCMNNIRNFDDHPTSLVYFNCNLNTNLEERKTCYDKVSNINFVNVDQSNLTYRQYLNRIKEHKFVLSPRGNGLDCHRTWEILMMRRIPILKREGQLEELYKNIPVLFVDDWTDIDSIDLEKVFIEFNFENQEYLYFDFWKKKI